MFCRILIVMAFPFLVLLGGILLGLAGMIYVSAILVTELKTAGR